MAIKKEIFVKALKEIMLESGITQKELSNCSGVGQSSISGYINDENKPTLKTQLKLIEAIKKILGHNEDYIIQKGSIEKKQETIEDNRTIFKLNDSLEAEHLSIIRQFKNKDLACSINRQLVELEALDSTALAEIIVEIKKKIKETKAAKKRTSNGEE